MCHCNSINTIIVDEALNISAEIWVSNVVICMTTNPKVYCKRSLKETSVTQYSILLSLDLRATAITRVGIWLGETLDGNLLTNWRIHDWMAYAQFGFNWGKENDFKIKLSYWVLRLFSHEYLQLTITVILLLTLGGLYLFWTSIYVHKFDQFLYE